jgi:transposase
MSRSNRNQPKRSKASESQYSLMEFMRDFPDDATCLDWLWRERFSWDGRHAECPKCERERAFYRVKSRPSYCCDACGHHLHPTAGTIFHKSATSLHLWFYAMYLMTSTRCGISAKHIEREIGVTYKTAWRMCNLIRNQLMDEDPGMLSGEVEVDETYIGGKIKNSDRRKAAAEGRDPRGPHVKPRTSVMAAVERGGRVRATIVPDSRSATLHANVESFVMPSTVVYTDDWHGYAGLDRRGYTHHTINHSDRIYVSGHVHTQTIEGFFGNFKTGVRGAHHFVSRKWLQGYLNEWSWRYNHRHDPSAMFRTILVRAVSITR